jgi:hypothetical protein
MTSCRKARERGCERIGPIGERARLVVPASPTRKTNFSQMTSSMRSLVSTSMPASAQASRDPELAGMFDQHLARLETSFAAALARARADGQLRPGAGPESAGMLVAVVQGMNVMAKARPGRRALQGVVDATLAGLVAPSPTA